MLFSMLKEDWETSRKARLSYPFICSMSCKEKKEKNNQRVKKKKRNHPTWI